MFGFELFVGGLLELILFNIIISSELFDEIDDMRDETVDDVSDEVNELVSDDE